MHVVVFRRDVERAAIAASPNRALPSRWSVSIRKSSSRIGVHMAAIPYEPPLARPVKGDPEGQDADQVAASARLHYAGRDGFGNVGGLGPCSGQVRV